MTVYEALSLITQNSILLVSLISLIITLIIVTKDKK